MSKFYAAQNHTGGLIAVNRFLIIAVVFVVLIVLREVWRICMAFYSARQVRAVMMDGWYQWSIHGGRLSTIKRLGVLASLLSLYEEYGVGILPGFDLVTQEEVANLMNPDHGMTDEELVQITDRLFNHISKIRNGEEAIEAEMV